MIDSHSTTPTRDSDKVPQGYTHLDWDSRHFGVSVATIMDTAIGAMELRHSLANARSNNVHLVYWLADEDRLVPAALLTEYHGSYTGTHVDYESALARIPIIRQTCDSSNIQVYEYSKGPATAEILALAILAGEHSRFNKDSRISTSQFRRLYRTWVDRSTRHEIADVVLVARVANMGTVGLITVSRSRNKARIGLVAITKGMRRNGIASHLLNAAHIWMRHNNIDMVAVKTQLSNTGACRLYERVGYSPVATQHNYHFWPSSNGT